MKTILTSNELQGAINTADLCLKLHRIYICQDMDMKELASEVGLPLARKIYSHRRQLERVLVSLREAKRSGRRKLK